MDINKFAQFLSTKIPEDKLLVNEPMKQYTTFKVGGPADLFVKPSTIEELIFVVQSCRNANIPFYIIGNGSNLLVSDEGFRGVIIQVYKNLSKIKVEGNYITAEAGALLAKVAVKALGSGLAGFEFAHGIPGTIGGAVVMNAGAYGGEMDQVIVECTVLNEKGQVETVSKEELELGYRRSSVVKNNWIVLSATIKLNPGNPIEISAMMKDFAGRRRDKQPLDKPSAGSTFKRPEGYFAGKLIMDAGLRGYKIGGAMVSDKHCGFVVTDGEATCEDIKAVISHVQKEVLEQFGVTLETEVKML